MGYDKSRKDWSVMTKTYAGVVSYVRGLDLRECVEMYNRLHLRRGEVYWKLEVHPNFERSKYLVEFPDWLNRDESGYSAGPYMYRVDDTAITTREAFGPEGWEGFEEGDVEEWPQYKPVFVDADGNIAPDELQEHDVSKHRERKEQHDKWLDESVKETMARLGVHREEAKAAPPEEPVTLPPEPKPVEDQCGYGGYVVAIIGVFIGCMIAALF